MKKLSIGQSIYKIELDGSIEKGTITELLEDGVYISFGRGLIGGGTYNSVFATEEEAQMESTRRKNTHDQNIKNQTDTPEKLMQYLYQNYCHSYENGDEPALQEQIQHHFGISVKYL